MTIAAWARGKIATAGDVQEIQGTSGGSYPPEQTGEERSHPVSMSRSQSGSEGGFDA
jgi:hypothetical protein